MIYTVKHFNLKALAEARRRKTWSILSSRRKARPTEVKTLPPLLRLRGKAHKNPYLFPTPSVNTVDNFYPSDV
jgi:hypothetical protein